MSRRRLRASALGVALLAFGLAGVQAWRASALRTQALEAARRGAAWLVALDIPLKDPAIPWIVSVIDAEYCRPPRMADWVTRRFEEFDGRRHPIYIALRGLALGARDAEFEAFSVLWQRGGGKGDDVAAMAYGVYCDRLPRPEVISRTVRRETSAEYELTHQFLALLYMRQNGCLAPEDERSLELAAAAIAVEQQEDTDFSDLWAERLAVLLYGDYRSLVDDAWIRRLVEEQQPSGAW